MSEPQKPETPTPASEPKAEASASASASTEEQPKLSPAELKKKAKAEKQARRAAEKESKGLPAEGAPPAANGVVNGESSESKAPAQGEQQQQEGKQQQQQQSQQKGKQKQGGHERKPSGQLSGNMPVRTRRGSQSAPKEQAKKQDSKNVELFSHLYLQPRRSNVDGASDKVHSSVVAFGFQIASYEICGSSARCVGMLYALKDSIAEYATPTGTSLARHMTAHHLSPQIDFIKSCRPISESMGNAIRWLKKLVAEVDPSTPDHEAIEFICESIDQFIRERIMVTDQVISASAHKLIKNGSVVLTYAKSAIIETTILRAHSEGKKFRVICVDSRPLFEGKQLALSLVRAGLEVEYVPYSGLNRAVANATVLLLGAHSMLSNGSLQSRIGTAGIAMAAHRADVPVIVCCESVKFSGKVALDSIVVNEVAPAEELLFAQPTALVPTAPTTGKGAKDEDTEEPKLKALNDFRDIPNLQILNLMYDVTPAAYISMVICEYGSVPPSSVPVVHRLANEGE